MIYAENAWRNIECPLYGNLYCEIDPVCECEGAINCPAINNIWYDHMNNLDTNGDG
jgi:hypothetical protein